MKKSSFTETQIVAVLKEADASNPVKEICRQHGISDATYYGSLSDQKRRKLYLWTVRLKGKLTNLTL